MTATLAPIEVGCFTSEVSEPIRVGRGRDESRFLFGARAVKRLGVAVNARLAVFQTFEG